MFIYVVLSLFIAIIMDAYEVVKDRYSYGLSVEHSVLKDFVATAPSLSEMNSPTAQAQFAPQALLNLDVELRPPAYSFQFRWVAFILFHSGLDAKKNAYSLRTHLLKHSQNPQMSDASLGAGSDSNSVRALHLIDRMRDWACNLRGSSRFESFSNPLSDQVDPPHDGVVLSTQRV
ncbi:unnamed protein product [Strongylus vulgaris]|uniref:Uncharacterized protein n=1 Tax=Strongylus vulgaris TaxID=40348 RepID=A0A3P7K7W5_STRVU|nr:unnamed protein product [Strongylus vulgaris]